MTNCNNISALACLSQRKNEYLAFERDEKITWCSGCGNYSILNALKRALTLEGIKAHEVVLCFDIGCNSNAADKINAYTVHGLHGRVLPLASGVQIAKPDLPVIALAGDGATFSEGVNHLVHTIRNDYPILFIHHNNSNYALTTGQASAVTERGQKMNGTPGEVTAEPLNTLNFVLSLNPSFVARSVSTDVDHMTEMIRLGLNHKGFAFLEMLQLCPTYNRNVNAKWLLENTENISKLKSYDHKNLNQALKLVNEEEKLHYGLIYKNEKKENFYETLRYKKNPQADLREEVRHYDISEVINKYH